MSSDNTEDEAMKLAILDIICPYIKCEFQDKGCFDPDDKCGYARKAERVTDLVIERYNGQT